MGAITEEILESLYDMVFHPYRVIYGYFPKEVSRKSALVAIHRLQKKGYIEKCIMEQEICIKLTELGLKKLQERQQKQKEKVLLNKKVSNEKWDGKWRIVVFDIPEVNKRIRGVLRETLKVLEFKPLQRSVWISKNNFTTDLREWVNDLGLSDFILIFETKDLGLKPILQNLRSQKM